MIYLVRSVEFVDTPETGCPIFQREINTWDYAEARVWLDRYWGEFVRPSLGRYATIARLDDGVIVEERRRDPVVNEEEEETVCEDEPGGYASEALDFLNNHGGD